MNKRGRPRKNVKKTALSLSQGAWKILKTKKNRSKAASEFIETHPENQPAK